MRRAGAFTLVELVLVMALLCVLLGVAVPSLSRSMHQRNLEQEATRVLGLTEYARDEATSQGVPMDVWINTGTGHFGAKAKSGYDDSGARMKEFTLTDGVHFDTEKNAAPAAGENFAAEFAPDGTLDPSSQASIRLVDRSSSVIAISQTRDASGYEIVKEAQ